MKNLIFKKSPNNHIVPLYELLRHVYLPLILSLIFCSGVLSQEIKWVHPFNTIIQGTEIKKGDNSKKWNASVQSCQYLLPEKEGSISFTIPTFNTQSFFISFSNGDIKPEIEHSQVGVFFQQRGPATNQQMAADIFINGVQVDVSRSIALNVGDQIKLELKGERFTLSINDVEYSEIYCSRTGPLICKVSFFTAGQLDNIQLRGDWEGHKECQCLGARQSATYDLPAAWIIDQLPQSKILLSEICQYVIDCPGCNGNALCAGDVLRIPNHHDDYEVALYHRTKRLNQVEIDQNGDYTKVIMPTDVHENDLTNYSLNIIKLKK